MAETQKTTEGASATMEVNEFSTLLNKQFKPQTDGARKEIETAVKTLAQQALASSKLISSDVVETINAMIAEIDRVMSKQINQIMHHPDFQALESAWRGLHYLVNNSETDDQLKIRVMNISKKDLHKTLKRYKGAAWDQSPIFKKLYEEEFGTLGGEPFACLVGDYYFDHGPMDVELLGEMAKIAAAAHAPFISAASPTTFGMESWQDLANPRDLTKIFSVPEYAGWRSLRDSEDARYLGLTMPRFLARRPYGAKTNPVEEFNFEEDASTPDAKQYTWANSAYAMAVNINRSFKLYGWCSRIWPRTASCPSSTRRTRTSPPSSAPSPCKSRRSTTTRTPPRMPPSPPACPICSPLAASRTT
jgi:type VI secretion system protein ImpC